MRLDVLMTLFFLKKFMFTPKKMEITLAAACEIRH